MALWKEDYVIVNEFSRPATKLLGVRGIVLHWTADPNATDENEKNFFDGSDGGGGRYASAHLFIDKDSATLIIPLDEVAYHANEKPCRIPKLQATKGTYVGGANLTAIGVEMCVEGDGSIHPDTIARTVQVVAELCRMYKLNVNDIYRHYDITGKNCPAPFVANSSLFDRFKADVSAALVSSAPVQSVSIPDKFCMNPSVVMHVKCIAQTDIRKAPDHRAGYVRDAQVGEIFDVYAIENDWHAVGGTNWIDGNNGHNLFWLDNPALKQAPPAPPQAKKRYVVLPASEPTWTVYKLDRPPVKSNPANIAGVLKPSKFGGLEYEILADRGNGVFEIQTSNFGRVQIYADPSATSARVIEK